MTRSWLIWALASVFGLTSYVLLLRNCPKYFQRTNFLGDCVPAIAGVGFVLCAEAAYIALTCSKTSAPLYRAAFILVTVFGLLGVIDDVYGDRSVGGLRGHLSVLARQGRLTTGAAKAIGGAVGALLTALTFTHNIMSAAIAALLIAMTSNAVNLTDTRPGRSLAAVLTLAACALVVNGQGLSRVEALTFLPPMALSGILFAFDRRAKIMIGDSGANTIGALAGLLWAVVTPFPAQLALIAFLIWFHVWTESHSLSATIESIAWLRKIDRAIGVRS